MVMTPHWGAYTMRTPRERPLLVDAKVSVQRLTTYTGALTFVLVLALWLDKAHDAYLPASNYFTFMASAAVAVAAIGIVGAIIDRVYIWPKEIGVNSSVSPLTATEAFRSAKHLVELESRGVDAHAIEETLRARFRECSLESFFDECLRTCRISR